MRSQHVYPLATAQWRFLTVIILAACAWLVAAPATAAEVATLEMESQGFDLDAATVIDLSPEDLIAPAGADVKLGYNADRTPHAVAFPVAEGVEMAFMPNVPFENVTAADIPNLSFSSSPIDLPFSANDTVVVRTDLGAVFKIGNAFEAESWNTFNYEQLQ